MSNMPAFNLLNHGTAFFNNTVGYGTFLRLAREGRRPEAIVVTWPDSRVIPEMIFKAEVGQLFTIHATGGILGASEIVSIEFAALVLNVPICIVIGQAQDQIDSTLRDELHVKKQPAIPIQDKNQGRIESGAECAQNIYRFFQRDSAINTPTLANVRRMMAAISANSPRIKERQDCGEFMIKGCVYNKKDTSLTWVD